jgi:hypothetical protein
MAVTALKWARKPEALMPSSLERPGEYRALAPLISRTSLSVASSRSAFSALTPTTHRINCSTPVYHDGMVFAAA